MHWTLSQVQLISVHQEERHDPDDTLPLAVTQYKVRWVSAWVVCPNPFRRKPLTCAAFALIGCHSDACATLPPPALLWFSGYLQFSNGYDSLATNCVFVLWL